MWGTNGQNNAGIGVDLLVVMVLLVFLVVVLPLPLVLVRVIFGYLKKRSSITRFACAATAKSLGAHSQSSQKINTGKYKDFLLLLSLKKRRR
jgi:hypothetical protein